jgi:hypothetical protein
MPSSCSSFVITCTTFDTAERTALDATAPLASTTKVSCAIPTAGLRSCGGHHSNISPNDSLVGNAHQATFFAMRPPACG